VSRKQEDKGLTYLVLAALMIMIAVALGGGCARPSGESMNVESCNGEVACESATGNCYCNTEEPAR
jgi:hypothetical protein